MKISKPKILLGIPIGLLSLEIYFGVIFGYLITKFLSGRQVGQMGIIKSLILNIGNWKLHLHHWLFGLGILISIVVFSLSLPFPQFSVGFFGGLVFQGISCYPDWYRILIKKS